MSTGISTEVAGQPAASRKLSAEEFVAYVLSRCQSTRVRADLRRGVGLPVERCGQSHRYLAPLTAHLHPESERAHYAVASLIAARPRSARDADDAEAEAEAEAVTESGSDTQGEATIPPKWWERSNLGASFADAVNAGAMKAGSAESELHLLTRQSSEALHERLPSLTRHMLGAGVTIDWVALINDLSWWNRSQERIATRWLVSYFRGLGAPEAEG